MNENEKKELACLYMCSIVIDLDLQIGTYCKVKK